MQLFLTIFDYYNYSFKNGIGFTSNSSFLIAHALLFVFIESLRAKFVCLFVFSEKKSPPQYCNECQWEYQINCTDLHYKVNMNGIDLFHSVRIGSIAFINVTSFIELPDSGGTILGRYTILQSLISTRISFCAKDFV